MLKCLKYLIISICLILLLTPYEATYGQFFLSNEAPTNIEISFARYSIDAAAQTTFFNTLRVRNNNNRQENLTLNITIPQGWSIIGSSKIDFSLEPNDSTIIPLRISVGSNVRGDIGYSVIASISDARGNTVKNEYCYVKIPRVADFSVRFPDRMAYFDPTDNTSKLTARFSNRGNREEQVNLLLDGSLHLGIGERNMSEIARDILIPAYTDTTITYPIQLATKDIYGRNMFGLKAIISTIDTTQQTTIWFRKLESSYKNLIPQEDKPLVVEIVGRGLLESERDPIIAAIIEGKTLFTGEGEVYYYYQNYNSKTLTDFYLDTRIHLGGIYGPWQLEIGDNYRSFQSSMYGRGAYAAYKTSKVNVEAVANRNKKTNIENLGGEISYFFTPQSYVKTGGTYNRSETNSFNSKIGYIGTGFNVGVHNIYALASYNLLEREIDGVNKHNEFGGEFGYSSRIGNTHNTISARYGSPLYTGIFSGRLRIRARTRWQLDLKNRLQLTFQETRNERPKIQGNTLISQSNSYNRIGEAEHTHMFSPNLQVYWGPGVIQYYMEGVPQIESNTPFETLNIKLNGGLRLRTETGRTSVSPRVEISQGKLLSNPYRDIETSFNSGWFGYQYFSLNIRTYAFNVLTFYTSGPRSIFEQLYFARDRRENRKLQFMPAYDNYIYKDVVRLYAGISYTNDIVARSTFSNITGQLYWYLPKNWRVHALGVYSTQKRTTTQDDLETFQNLYIEAGIRKELDIHQPRVKYHNATLVFFRDYNGNFIQEENEPGIKNVLVSISKVESDVVGRIPGEFYNAELISDNTGKVYLDRIPEGRYHISYNPIGSETGTYSKVLGDTEINITKSEYHNFPFVEQNKVFGKIILNRSRLSGLGRMDLSNVRVTATDSQGRSHSTLTDRNGEFVLFAPVTDEYILTINNIFYENFDLRQNSFLVQFNGYKQFEVNFVFDEKVRRINFAASDQEMQQGVQQVRRTTISGSVKDANTQQAIRARVNLINTRTNAIVASVNSSATSGDYTLNFMASDDYLLEVLADDYWYFSENLVLQQVTTFMNINRNIQLKPISVGSSIELNIQFGPNSDYLAPESVAELNRLLRQVRNNPTVRLEIQGHCDDLEAIQKPDIGRDRAGAVAKYLIENGFSNVEVKDMKNQVPLTSNDTEEGRARNRRIDVVVLRR
jgi:outer membrane protein OmpA-like peptidoglycan-associated protein